MIVLGLTGGIASGKSTVAAMFKELGAHVIDWDVLAQEVVLPHAKAWEGILRHFGNEVLNEDLTINRDKLSEIVFDDAERLAQLNQIVHPAVVEEDGKRTDEIRKRDPEAVIIKDIPLLLEVGGQSFVDKVVVVNANQQSQIERMKGRGLAAEEARKRMNAQMPLEDKVNLADYVIQNDGSIEETRRQVEKVFGSLQRGKWQRLVRRLEALLRLRTFPVAIKLLEDAAELSENKFVRRLPHQSMLCQLITIVRTYDWTVGATLDELNEGCASIVGMTDIPNHQRDGTFRSIIWCKTKEDGSKCEASIPRIPNKYKALILAPLVYDPFEPDIVLIYGNPAQMILIINALQFEDYERLQFFCVGESSCSDAIAQCYLTGKPSLTVPCYGERRYGGVQDDEMVMALPPNLVEKVERNLEELYKRGICYPISPLGAQVDPISAMPPAYQQLMRGETPEALTVLPRRITRW